MALKLNKWQWLGLAIVVVAAIVGVVKWDMTEKAQQEAARLAAEQALHAPIVAKNSYTVESGSTLNVRHNVERTPGRLYGTWLSQGRSAGISGAVNDSLVAFELRGPNNELLQSMRNIAAGNFDMAVTAPGVYTFVLDNHGAFRESQRIVEIDSTYKPD